MEKVSFINFPFLASSTIINLEESNEINNNNNENNNITSTSSLSSHTWSICHHTSFLLRSGQNYSKNQEKSPSPPSIMNIIGVDIIRTENRIDHIASFIELHSDWLNIEPFHDFIPPLFVINAQVNLYLTLLYFTLIFFD